MITDITLARLTPAAGWTSVIDALAPRQVIAKEAAVKLASLEVCFQALSCMLRHQHDLASSHEMADW